MMRLPHDHLLMQEINKDKITKKTVTLKHNKPGPEDLVCCKDYANNIQLIFNGGDGGLSEYRRQWAVVIEGLSPQGRQLHV